MSANVRFFVAINFIIVYTVLVLVVNGTKFDKYYYQVYGTLIQISGIVQYSKYKLCM